MGVEDEGEGGGDGGGSCSKFGSSDFPHAGLNAGPYWHLVPLTRFDVDFQKLVNLDTLIPLLNQGGILSPVELRELYVVHRSESWRISYLLSMLDRKGKQGIKALIFALKSDEEHMGHQELGAHLEEEYCKSNTR